ncbi:NADH-quinone oxidoreductase subunit L [Myxococcota bacterium]|nr:NADH-quinone oxidoreductase subunit L [Myxococcota bacterium]
MNPALLGLVPAFPLFGAILIALLNRKASRVVAGGIATLMVSMSAALSFWTLATLWSSHGALESLHHRLYEWISVGGVQVDIAFLADPLTAVMMCVVTGVGALIHLYSVGYMDDPADAQSTWRFFAYLNLFVFAMLLLIMGDNFLLMFVGWEGVGLCSYLLIGFWYKNTDFAKAGKKAFITNRVGDFSFLIGLFMLFWALGDQATLSFVELKGTLVAQPELVGGHGGTLVTAIALLLFGGATGKSAQIPLFVWLPDAMAGPTPVSALIHAATMVTSGIYMISRLSFLFAMAPVAMGVIATVGALTALFAATIAMTQTDIKKVLAYSTVSQLGYMFLGVGVGAFTAGFFHVVTHAFFKALLFLGAGAVIHAMHHEQDMRKMGGLLSKMKITGGTMLVAWLAIIGFPGTSGFFSKDEILWLTFAADPAQLALFGPEFPLPKLLWIIGAITAAMTAFYMSRLVFMTFFGAHRGGHGHDDGHGHHDDAHGHGHGHTPHEVSPLMWAPLAVLALLSLGGGLLNLPHWIHVEGLTGALHHFLEPVFAAAPMSFDGADSSLELPLMGLTLLMILTSVFIAWYLYVRNPGDLVQTKDELVPDLLYRGSLHKWWVDELYEATLIKPIVLVSRQVLWAVVDAELVDGAVNGAAKAMRRISEVYGELAQTGRVQTYAMVLAAGTAVIVFAFAVGG